MYRQTPLILSTPLSNLAKRDVYLKLDLLQASGSFKDRGMAVLCQNLKEKGVKILISSSGGNAGLAVATVGQKLDMEVQVIVPETTKQIVIDKLKSLGAHVTVHGVNWNAADQLARERVSQNEETAAYVSPYDNPLLWEGHASVVDEVQQELGRSPAAMIVSVGGGGLVCGVLEGARKNKWKETTIVAAETEGANCFGAGLKAGKPVRLEGINSVATSLGALECTPVAIERAKEHQKVISLECTDQEAVDACVKLAQDHRMLVEPACGAALAVVYTERLRNELVKSLDGNDGPIVVEVCGGSGVNIELLSQWKDQFNV